jgi:hypothetical protein
MKFQSIIRVDSHEIVQRDIIVEKFMCYFTPTDQVESGAKYSAWNYTDQNDTAEAISVSLFGMYYANASDDNK